MQTNFISVYEVLTKTFLHICPPGYVQFINKDVSDTKPAVLDNTLRLLSQLLVQWKSNIISATSTSNKPNTSNSGNSSNKSGHGSSNQSKASAASSNQSKAQPAAAAQVSCLKDVSTLHLFMSRHYVHLRVNIMFVFVYRGVKLAHATTGSN